MEYDTKGQILNTRHLTLWPKGHQRQQRLREFCHSHNDYGDYAPLVALFSFSLMHKKERFCT